MFTLAVITLRIVIWFMHIETSTSVIYSGHDVICFWKTNTSRNVFGHIFTVIMTGFVLEKQTPQLI